MCDFTVRTDKELSDVIWGHIRVETYMSREDFKITMYNEIIQLGKAMLAEYDRIKERS